jgi:hypothetical protein
MCFYIHPLTVFILPAILSVYSIILEEKRFKAKYGLAPDKRISASHPLGSGPERLEGFRWDIDKALGEYEESVKEKAKRIKSKDQ